MKQALIFMAKQIAIFVFYCVFVFGLSVIITGAAFTSDPKEIKTDKKYVYVRKYKIFNYKSEIVKYPAPKTFDGIIEDASDYEALINIGGESKRYDVNNYCILDSLKENDKVMVKEMFWPRHEVELKKR